MLVSSAPLFHWCHRFNRTSLEGPFRQRAATWPAGYCLLPSCLCCCHCCCVVLAEVLTYVFAVLVCCLTIVIYSLLSVDACCLLCASFCHFLFFELFLMDVWAEAHTPFPSSHRRLHNVMGLMGGWDYFQDIPASNASLTLNPKP